MKRVICNYCRKEVPAEGAYQMPPTGWITVNYRGRYDERHTDLDFCQPTCAVAYIDALAQVDASKETQESVNA